MISKTKYLLLLLLVLVVSLPVMGQEEETEPSEIRLFRGGYMNVNFGLNLNTLGSSLGSGSMGGLISSRVDNGALNIHLNPALLGFMSEGQLIFDSRVGLGTNISGGLNNSLVSTINDELKTTIDETFDDEASWTKFPETYISATEVRDLDVGFSGQMNSFAFAAPLTDRFVLAGAYSYPVSLDFDLGVTGIAAKLAQEQGTDEVSIRFDVLMNISLLTQMNFQMSSLSAGLGAKVLDSKNHKLALGATVSRYQVNSTRRLQADLSGMVVVGGADERYFNNPSDPNLNSDLGETNSFFMNANGTYESTEYGMKFGAYYEFEGKLRLSMVYDYMPDFNLVGNNNSASAFLPVFMVGSGEDILGGNIEVALDSLKANKPNLTTERDISKIVEDGSLNLPSSFTVGLDVPIRQHTMVLNYTKYTSEFSFTNGDDIIGKNLSSGIGVGFDFKLRDKMKLFPTIVGLPFRLLFLDIDGLLFQSLGSITGYKNSHYRFGGNILLGDGIVSSDNNDLRDILSLPLPQTFSLGRQYTIFEKIDVGVTVLAVPDMVLKYSVGIRF